MKHENDEKYYIREHELETLTHRKLKRIARGIQRETGCSYFSAMKQIAHPLKLEAKELIALAKEESSQEAPETIASKDKIPKSENTKDKTFDVFGFTRRAT